MKVIRKRWGEVTVKKQGNHKNRFDCTKSFSIEQTPWEYDIGQLKDLLELVVDLTQHYDFEALMEKIDNLRSDND